jgi:hypothetical protein
MLPIAMVYVAWRCLVPKLVRRQSLRTAAVLQAYRDFRHGVHGQVRALPGDDQVPSQ